MKADLTDFILIIRSFSKPSFLLFCCRGSGVVSFAEMKLKSFLSIWKMLAIKKQKNQFRLNFDKVIRALNFGNIYFCEYWIFVKL